MVGYMYTSTFTFFLTPKKYIKEQFYIRYKTTWMEGRPLAGVAQWIEYGPVNQRVAGSIPSQGTCLGFRAGPQ